MTNWRKALGRPTLTLEEFQELCLQAVLELFPDASIKPGLASGELVLSRNNKEPLSVFLGNVWATCRYEPDVRAREVERFLRIVMTSRTATDRPPDTRFIVPMIKDHGYLEVASRASGRPQFVHEHFVGDLWIVYAIDEPDRMSSLLESQLQQLGIVRDNLRELALNNLRRILPPVERHGNGPLYMLTAGGDYGRQSVAV